MPKWMPSEIWKGQDAYIIGGGPSLEHFNWDLLRDKNTIGCNAAFKLGVDICKVCFFADGKFFRKFKEELAHFSGMVVTNHITLVEDDSPWLKWMPREQWGLHHNALGYNSSSGAAAINLALLMGATRVFLLGMDLGLKDGRANWHKHGGPPKAEVYSRFRLGFARVAHTLPKAFPGMQVVNVHDFNHLTVFPTVRVAAHFGIGCGSGLPVAEVIQVQGCLS